ncbi:mucin TcMUC [Trypanosoma cruzi]|uniref:Mucin TcMUC n=1 Tax=Trypanosoma cruzi TaxID=5693 RepID=A0A7J6XVX1_TRYCR|nr:mucin TcMUC [Trypanosoma cruzi]
MVACIITLITLIFACASAAAVASGLHEVVCAEYERRPKATVFAVNIGCTSRGPTIHVVCGDHSFFHFYFAFLLLCALHLLLCVCVPSVRGADTTDRSRRMCMRWSLVCRSCLLIPLPSVCWCCGRAVCVCVCLLPWIGVCVVRGVRRTVHAWLLPSPHVVCPLCVCLPHLSSPLLLSMSLTVQISSTPLNDHTHDDDDVPSAVRPVGARPVLLPVRLRGRE